jgi:asparagine synthase (glutamine-hydrolysing)
VWAETEGAAPLDRLLALNLRTYLLDDLLPKVDRMAMAHGLEVRSPFLDTALAEFVLRLPPRFKVRGLTLKRMLKSVARDLLPKDILGRRKHGFGVPLDSWFRDDLRSYVSSRLCAADARVGEYLDRDAVRALVAEHQSGSDRSPALWALVTLEVFLRREGW